MHIHGEWFFADGHDDNGDGNVDEGDGGGGTQTARASDIRDQHLGGYVYGDGSCEPSDIRGLDRAGVAILEVNGAGDVLKAFHFPLPRPFPQTSQASEFVMVAQARRLLARRATLLSDCLNVVRAAASPIRRALAPNRLYAGICLDRYQMIDQDKLIQDVQWVKSHRALGGNEDAVTARNIKGNAAADRLAKAAVKAHPRPTALQSANLAYYARRAHLVARAIATALASFPSSEPERLTRAQAPRSTEEAERRQIHWWRYDESKWRCRICNKWSTGEQLERHHFTERCPGPRAETEAKSWVGWGHRISVAKGAVPIAFCTKCGAWGNRRARKLRAACAAPTAAGVAALKNIAAGKHPWQRRLPGGGQCTPLTPAGSSDLRGRRRCLGTHCRGPRQL